MTDNTIKKLITEIYRIGEADGGNAYYNSDYAGGKDDERPIRGLDYTINKYLKRFKRNPNI